jgi:hypothetical protein
MTAVLGADSLALANWGRASPKEDRVATFKKLRRFTPSQQEELGPRNSSMGGISSGVKPLDALLILAEADGKHK